MDTQLETIEVETGAQPDAAVIWQAFSVPGTPFTPSGVFANQPSPYPQRYRGINLVFLLLAGVLLLLFVGRMMTADREEVFAGKYMFQPNSGEAAFVTDQFALREAGTMPVVLNGANEVAVEAFLAGRIGFREIHRIIGKTMQKHANRPARAIEAILEVDRWAREQDKALIH